jgi:hypothetical protein
VLVPELVERLGLPALLDEITVTQRRRAATPPAQVILALCETLIAGASARRSRTPARRLRQEQLRGHLVPGPTTLGRFLARRPPGSYPCSPLDTLHLSVPVGTHAPALEHLADCIGTSVRHHITSLITHGTFEKFPTLRFQFSEYGCSWLPSLISPTGSELERLRGERRVFLGCIRLEFS